MTITELNKLIFTDKTICNLCLTQGARVTEYIPVTKIATSL
jgi:hypothetical protein